MSILPPINRGTGAGGAATNLSGKTFEEKTNNELRLQAAGWTRQPIPGSKGKFSYFLQSPDGTRRFVTQGGLKVYAAAFWKKELFRCPDEAYIVSHPGRPTLLKILEKKAQNVPGSVDQKLCDGAWFKEEYAECLGPDFTVDYAFCLSKFLKEEYLSAHKKWTIMRTLHARHGIHVLFGDDADYFTRLDTWLA